MEDTFTNDELKTFRDGYIREARKVNRIEFPNIFKHWWELAVACDDELVKRGAR